MCTVDSLNIYVELRTASTTQSYKKQFEDTYWSMSRRTLSYKFCVFAGKHRLQESECSRLPSCGLPLLSVVIPFVWKSVPSEVTVHQVVFRIDRFINFCGLATVLPRLREKAFCYWWMPSLHPRGESKCTALNQILLGLFSLDP